MFDPAATEISFDFKPKFVKMTSKMIFDALAKREAFCEDVVRRTKGTANKTAAK